ncbi:MAG: zinc ABC transporter substrate-binding protein [Parcubacteria group bacterium]|nr:zinc ABC transporter substrate-binding protein [Parcubacteria group bacterium]
MKNSIKYLVLGVVLLSSLAWTGCKLEKDQPAAAEKTNVLVSILPLAEFASQVGGDKVVVESVIPSGYEPHSYELTPAQLTKIAEADLYVKAGHIEFEKSNMDKIVAQNEVMKVINGSNGITWRDLEDHDRKSIHELENDTYDENSTGDQPDPHTWLSVKNAKIYGQNITDALSEIDPDNQDYYQQNKEKYLAELNEVDTYLHKKLDQLENKKIIVYHPAFGYLLDDYGLRQIPVEIEGKEPTAAQLAELIATAKKENIKTIFVQKQFSPKNAETIAAEIGGSVVQIDPLAVDFTANLREIGAAIGNN